MQSCTTPAIGSQYQIIASERNRQSILIVPCDAASSRQYVLNKASVDGSTLYFRCRRCQYLNKSKPISGRTYAVNVRLERGSLRYPYGEEHHPRCFPEPNGLLKALEIHRKHKRNVREGREEPYVAYVKAVHEAKQKADAFDFIGSWTSMDASYEKHYSKFLRTSEKGKSDNRSSADVLLFGRNRSEHNAGSV